MAINIYFTYRAYVGIEDEDLKTVIITLLIAFITLMITFIVVSRYFVIQLKKNKDYKTLYTIEQRTLKDQVLTNKYKSDCLHNIAHYYRNCMKNLDLKSDKVELLSKEEKQKIITRVDFFLVVLTSNLQNYFSFVTGDNCSITIKLASRDKKHFVTFFRDPINFNKRRKAYNREERYLIKNDSALSIITNPAFENTYFYADNLQNLNIGNSPYKNSNPMWKEFYNATLVVPITMIVEKKDKKTGKKEIENNVLGFLSVDNFKGKLGTDENKEFLLGVGDLLYILIEKYKNFIEIAYEDIKENQRVKISKMGN